VLKSAVEHVLTKTAIPERDRNVYREYALDGRDIGEVAAKYRISRNYVSQIRVRIDKRIVDFGKTLVAGA
jgi:DNA-directed RNA polymerase specialized sigma subunit